MALQPDDREVEDKTAQYLFGERIPWWAKHRWIRPFFFVPLLVIDRNYGRWRRAKVSPRRFNRLRERLDRQYPPGMYSPDNLIGREKEFNIIMDAFRLHVLRHPVLEKLFSKIELPKVFCLTGESGTGKTFLAMVALKQMLYEAHSNGVQIAPVIVRGSDVYSEFYGRSTRQLGKMLDGALSMPSVVYIDEFQTFGKKVRGETGTELEDSRVQDELNQWIDKVTTGRTRTMVMVATNSYEQIREDIRRRMTRIDLDSGVTREMVLALIDDSLKRENMKGVEPPQIMDVLEREATLRRRGSITPNDVKSVFREVKKARNSPLLESIRKEHKIPFLKLPTGKHKVTIDEFTNAARSMKL